MTASELRGWSGAFAGMFMALSNFMVVLDITVANVSVNTISGALAVSPSEGTWVITSYSVAEAIMLPLSGWLANRFGTVRVSVVCSALFGITSLLCGLSNSIEMLVFMRVLQGLSGGPIMPMSQTLLLSLYPGERRRIGQAIWGTTSLAAPVIGPFLGGWIADNFYWGWIFLINAPIALMIAIYVSTRLMGLETPIRKSSVDYTGFALLIGFVGPLQVVLDKGQELDWFDSPFIVGMSAISLVGFAAFLIWELTEKNPIVDLRVFRHFSYSMGVFFMGVLFAIMFSGIVLLPLWMQIVLGYTPAVTGRIACWQGVTACLVSPIVPVMIHRFGARTVFMIGLIMVGSAMIWRVNFTTGLTEFDLVMPFLLQGAGMPAFFVPILDMTFGTVEKHELASAAGVLNFVRTIGGATATSITMSSWTNLASEAKAQMAGRLNDAASAMSQMAASGIGGDQPRSLVDNLVQMQALTIASNKISLVCGIGSFLCAALVWVVPAPKPHADTSAAH